MIETTEIYGLVGHPLGHSFSRRYFNDRFARSGRDACYLNYDLPDISCLRRLIAATPMLRGLNVTIPYKQAVISQLDKVDDVAQAIGAVNVIEIARRPDGDGLLLTGHNTDVVGFARALSAFNLPDGCRALILGTGGASRAVCAALDARGVAWTYVSRTAAPGRLTYGDLTARVMHAHRLIVNCTPTGTWPDVDTCPPIPYNLLTPEHICVDLVYNPAVTRFMQRGADAGAAVRNGLCMLHAQAEAAWQIWRPDSQL